MTRSALASTLLNDNEALVRRRNELTTLTYPAPEHLFAVVSWGCAASHWVARALNDCPGVYCSHASNTFWTYFADAEKLDGVEYLKLIGMLGSGHLAAGDVHGVSRHHIPSIADAFGDRFRAAVLVRDPVPRLRSQMGLFERFGDAGPWDVDYLADKFPTIDGLLPSGRYEEWLFVHGANMLNAIVEEAKIGPIFRSEDLTTSTRSLSALVRHLTNEVVRPPRRWAKDAIARGKTNQHAHRLSVPFRMWQLEVLEQVVDFRARELYQDLGYRLGF